MPWTSVDAIQVKDATTVEVVRAGPVTPTGEQSRVWTDRALRKYRLGGVISVTAARPELAVWVARHYVATTLAASER